MNSMKRQKGAPSFEKPLTHESEVEEGANAQAEAQKKKDEAEVQVSLYTHGSHRSRNKGSKCQGCWFKLWNACLLSRTCHNGSDIDI